MSKGLSKDQVEDLLLNVLHSLKIMLWKDTKIHLSNLKTLSTSTIFKEVSMYNHLLNHIGHKIVCVCYGDPDDPNNVSIECEDCNEVLFSVDKEDKDEQDSE